jgi:leucyl-tRNA synthetase
MQGFNVLHPMGWDAFGLTSENYAIKKNISPQQAIAENTSKFKKQLMQMGFSYDWSREVNSSDPSYYKWTQYFFNLLFERGLAYQKDSLQWWCDFDKTVLANEQVEAGKCWRCGNPVVKKALKQWFFKITDYADRLADDLDKLDWSESIKTMQRNWIGKSKGAEIDFAVDGDLTERDFVFIHGFGGTNDRDFWHWLKAEIEKRGGKVYAPNLPDTNTPNVDEQAKYLLENYKFTDKTCIVAHSLGAAVTMKLLPQLDLAVESVILAAPCLTSEYRDKKSRPALESSCDWEFDFEIAKRKSRAFTVLEDTNDHIIPAAKPREVAVLLGADYAETSTIEGHFNDTVEPAVLAAITPKIKVFTTRPDTLFGATFMVLAPEHPLVTQIMTDDHKHHVTTYIKAAEAKTDVERQETDREKTGVFTGAYAINPVNQEKIPIWVADYVLYGYGTGAIMAVPAHDERDQAFAEKFNLPIVPVYDDSETKLQGSGAYDGLNPSEAKQKIVDDLAKQGAGKAVTNYKIRDWLISRQRYWGAPIPIIHCEKDGAVPVPTKDLPVVLPEVESYAPTGEGTSVLASVEEWVNVKCPKCGGPAKRETDTMDGFACSSWYFLRFADPHNDKEPFSKDKAKFWLPVDDYIGGAEHAVMHLLYARMWTKVMFDAGMIDFDEPFSALRNQGMILAPDGRKMSKSWGNTITPDEIIDQGYGADAIRIMELFIGPWNQSANWSVEGMGGCFRFLQRVWTLVQEHGDEKGGEDDTYANEQLLEVTHRTIKKVSNDLTDMSFNTAIAAMMEGVNEMYKIKAAYNFQPERWKYALDNFTQLLAPFAPHISEELWQQLGNEGSVHQSEWPKYDEKYLITQEVTVAVQVNGKLRATLTLPTDVTEEAVTEAAKKDSNVAAHLKGKTISRAIYVPHKLINLVIN